MTPLHLLVCSTINIDAEDMSIQGLSTEQGQVVVDGHTLRFCGVETGSAVFRGVPEQKAHDERSKKAIDHGVRYALTTCFW